MQVEEIPPTQKYDAHSDDIVQTENTAQSTQTSEASTDNLGPSELPSSPEKSQDIEIPISSGMERPKRARRAPKWHVDYELDKK